MVRDLSPARKLRKCLVSASLECDASPIKIRSNISGCLGEGDGTMSKSSSANIQCPNHHQALESPSSMLVSPRASNSTTSPTKSNSSIPSPPTSRSSQTLGVLDPMSMNPFDMTCVDCQIKKQPEAFEANRKVCKECRKKRRALSALKSRRERADTVLPETPSTHTCIMCQRNKDQGAKFTIRTDSVSVRWKSMCQECHNGMMYHQAYRQREKAKDKRGFLDHQAEIMKRWRANNAEHHRQYMRDYAKSVPGKISSVKSGAKTRGIFFNEQDEEIFSEIITRSCWYCDESPTGVNGLDRIDSNLGYMRSNVAACCSTCNFMKRTMSVSDFLEKVSNIAQHVGNTHDYSTSDMDTSTRMGNNRVCQNPDRKKMMLSVSEQIKLMSDPCYLCGGPGGGIDRVDSTQCYKPDNCKGCCKVCNYMKKDFTLDFFVYHVKRIHEYTQTL